LKFLLDYPEDMLHHVAAVLLMVLPQTTLDLLNGSHVTTSWNAKRCYK
jgi:hypothetical protein